VISTPLIQPLMKDDRFYREKDTLENSKVMSLFGGQYLWHLLMKKSLKAIRFGMLFAKLVGVIAIVPFLWGCY